MIKKVKKNGITLYFDDVYYGSCVYITDIDIDENIDVIEFFEVMDTPHEYKIDLRKSKKEFLNIRKMIINKRVKNIKILNRMFPNVKEITSYSPCFKSGNILVSTHNNNKINLLLNTFAKKPDETLDLKDVTHICNYSFDICLSQKIINNNKLKKIDEKAMDRPY